MAFAYKRALRACLSLAPVPALAAAGAAVFFSTGQPASLDPRRVLERPKAATAPALARNLSTTAGVQHLTRAADESAAVGKRARAEFENADHSLIHARRGDGEFERFDVWMDEEHHRTIALVRLGDRLCGHRGIVHGGATAAICDELFGWTAHRCNPGRPTRIFTASLDVHYKAPLPAGTDVAVTTAVVRRDGRKVFMEARVESPDGAVLYATAKSLFIISRDDHTQEHHHHAEKHAR
mmetsp:Transcript_18211/g.48997  ORF Transcript_18211/g.48997 Transcript_18211/m.48997 type:complete len:238 (-) Transcript_18211:229-942(-)